MKKYLHYIIDTFLCRFSKHFVLKNAKTKWLTYHLGSQENRNVVAIDSSKVTIVASMLTDMTTKSL